MKLFTTIAMQLLILATVPTVTAADLAPRSVIISTVPQACQNMLALASAGRAYLVRTNSTTNSYTVTVGWEWNFGDKPTDAEKIGLLTALTCLETGALYNRLNVDLQDIGGARIGSYSAGQLTVFPQSGFGGVNTVVTATPPQTCWAMLDLANKNFGALIKRSYHSTQLGYVAVVTDAWARSLTDQQKIATLLALACGAGGDILIKDHNDQTIGRLVAGQMELF